MKPLVVVAALLIAAGCTGDQNSEKELKSAVRAYSAAFFGGDPRAAHALLSQRCRERTPLTELSDVIRRASSSFRQPEIESLMIEELSDDRARVTYSYGTSVIDQQNEPWVREGGEWKVDDC